VTIQAAFTADAPPPAAQYLLTVQAGAGGVLVTGADGSFEAGEGMDLAAQPDSGYIFTEWTSSDGGVFNDAGSAATRFFMPAHDTVVTANFAPQAPAGAAPSIQTTGLPAAAEGETYSHTLQATGDAPILWSLAEGSMPPGLDLSGDGRITGAPSAAGAFTFTVEAANDAGSDRKALHITVTAAPAPTPVYTITAAADAGGAIAPAGVISVDGGQDMHFTITPDAGYHIADVLADGDSVGAVSDYTFVNVTADHSVTARFAQNSSGEDNSRDHSKLTPVLSLETEPGESLAARFALPGTPAGGVLDLSLGGSTVRDAIQNAQEAARRAGAAGADLSLVFVNEAAAANVSAITIRVDAAALTSLENAGVANLSLLTQAFRIGFDSAALAEIAARSDDAVQITVTSVVPTGLAGRLIGDRPVFQIAVTSRMSGETVDLSQLSAGLISRGIAYEPAAGENPDGLCVVFVDETGKIVFIENSAYAGGYLNWTGRSNSVYGVAYRDQIPDFIDTTNHWAKDDIDFVAMWGLLTGVGNGRFSPDAAMTRGMFVTVLGRLAGVDAAAAGGSGFTDVKPGAYYAVYVKWAAEEGIVSGVGGGLFAPDREISREEMATMLLHYAKKTGYALTAPAGNGGFADYERIAPWARDAVKAMAQVGVIRGKAANVFDPQGKATRAEASAMLRRFIEFVIENEV
jgi:hypothetical protein